MPSNGLAVGTNQLVVSGGNVGIGTTAPASPFHAVNSSDSSNPGLLVQNNSTTWAANLKLLTSRAITGNAAAIRFNYFDDGGTESEAAVLSGLIENRAASTRAGAFVFSTQSTGSANASERMRLTSSGNLGIGTSSPTALLHLKAGTATAGTAPLKFTSGTALTTLEDGALEFDGADLLFTSGGVRRTISSINNGTTTNIYNITNSSGSVTVTPSAGNSLIVNQTTVSTSSSTGALIVNGGAGVGGALNVAGNITGSANITAGTALYSPMIYGGTTASQNITIDSTSHATKGSILLAPSGGNVGIGTTSPASKLQVHGSILSTTGASVSGNGAIEFSDSGNGDSSAGSSIFGQSGGLSLSSFFSASNTAHLHIAAAGTVGIGTTSPSRTLDVRSSGSTGLHVAAGGASQWAELTLGNSSSTANQKIWGLASEGTNGRLYLRTLDDDNSSNPAVRMTLARDGTVGIGTSSPAVSLDVNTAGIYLSAGRQISSNSAAANLTIGGGNSGTNGANLELYGGSHATNASEAYLDAASFSIRSQDGVTTRMQVNSSGNVGIGTASIGTMLEVGGSGRFSGNLTVNSQVIGQNHAGPSATGDAPVVILRRARNTVASPQGVTALDSLGAIEFGGHDGSGWVDGWNGGSVISAFARETWSSSVHGSDLRFSTTSTGSANSTEKVRIDPNGNVGIGTTSPGTNLHVRDSDNYSEIQVQSVGADGYAVLSLKNDAQEWRWQTQGADADKLYLWDNTANNVRMVVTTAGHVGIGTQSPDERLVVNNGSTIGKYTTGGWTHSSDGRLKQDVRPLANSLERILKLQPVEYVFKNDASKTKQVGFIAQQVEPVYPEVVQTDKEGMKSMIYANLVAPLVGAVQGLFIRLTGVEGSVEQLRAENDRVKKKLDELNLKITQKDNVIAELNGRLQRQEQLLQERLEAIETALKNNRLPAHEE